jgi:hypothetical protein
MKLGDIIIAKTTVVCLFEKGRKYHIIDLNDGLILLKPIDSEGRNLVLHKQFAFDNFEKVIDKNKNNNEVKMNLIEAMKYLMEDKNNIVIGNRGNSLFKIDGDHLWENPSMNWTDDGWYKSNGEFEIYKEEKLYSLDEVLNQLVNHEFKSFTSIEDDRVKIIYVGVVRFLFENRYHTDIDVHVLKGKWRK